MSHLYEETSNINPATRKNHKQLVNYCVRFAWQVVFCTLIATSYIVLNIFVVFNILDAPRSISLSHLLRTIEQWAAWSWGGGPGAVLGFLACVVAFSKNPTLPQEPQKGSPAAMDACNDQDSDLGEEDASGNLPRSHHVLTAEKLHVHGATNSDGLLATPERPQAALTNISGVGGWNVLCTRIGLSTISRDSGKVPSRNQAPSSEGSTRTGRNGSPFQILSLTSSNFVRISPAQKGHPAPHLNTTTSHYRPSHLLASEATQAPHSSSLPSTPACPSPGAQSIGFQSSYPLPAPIFRSQSSDVDSFLPTPSTRDFSARSPAPGHFEAIHQLRGRG